MRTRTALSTSLLIPALLLSIAAAPGVRDESTCRAYDATDPDSPVICEVETYLQCGADEQKVVAPVDPPVLLGYAVPDRSVQDGAGCGYLDEPVFGSPTMDSYYELDVNGDVDGPIDSATVDLWLLGPGVAQLGEGLEIDVRLTIDGASVFGAQTITDVTGAPSTSPTRLRIAPEVTPSETQASVRLRFTVTGIGAYLEGATLDEASRWIQMTVNYPHTGDCEGLPPNGAERCVPGGVTPWAWGTTEVPAGITFNELGDLGTIVPAQTY